MKLIQTHPDKPRQKQKAMFDVELDGSEHILPCPFCGDTPQLTHTWTASYWFECIHCGAELHDDKMGRDAHNGQHHLASARRALKRWNTRV